MEYEKLLKGFVAESRRILGENLVGVYLHGSAVMGCFHPEKSDLDLLVVVEGEIPLETKREYLDMVVAFHGEAPAKGLEMSIVRRAVCDPFVYPTPFELHFSLAHLDWYRRAPEEYAEKMKGVDPDLAAHVTILRHRGETLYGEKIDAVFGQVGKDAYLDSIWRDIAEAETEILENPMYITLNLCRVLAYVREGAVLSKQEGGDWGLRVLPEEYRGLVRMALEEYGESVPMKVEAGLAREYAGYMLRAIREET